MPEAPATIQRSSQPDAAGWRRVMDNRVVAHYGGDVTPANIHPAARERVLARYPGSVSLDTALDTAPGAA